MGPPSYIRSVVDRNVVMRGKHVVDCVWNVVAHALKPDFVFRWNGPVHLNRRGRQFSRLLTAEVCASAVVMLDTPCSEAVWRVLATHSIRQFPLHFPSYASPCAFTFQLESTFLCQKYKSRPYHGAQKTSLIGGLNNCAQGFFFPILLSSSMFFFFYVSIGPKRLSVAKVITANSNMGRIFRRLEEEGRVKGWMG